MAEANMFKVGDRVRRTNGARGTVVEVKARGWLRVLFDGQSAPGAVHVNALTKVEGE